jgi:4-amino-4-deoxy-L-arabinose transferase-like glycosyltransferase
VRHGVSVVRELLGRRGWLIAIVVIGIVMRTVIRLASGEAAFLTNGYSFYLAIAENLVAGNGFCYAPEESCALRMPLYPLVLAPLAAVDIVYPAIVIVQALLGGLLAWIAWWLGRELFSDRVGAIAAIATALNPYAVLHDTALQDTALLNFLVAGSIALLLRAARANTAASWLAAGLVLALAVLTSARIVLFVPLAIVWASAAARGPWPARLKTAMLMTLPIVVLLGGWMVRNWRVAGAPVLTTEGGEALYFGNSSLTFRHFPERSIDLTAGEIERLPAGEQRMLASLAGQDVALDRLYRRLALDYIAANPTATTVGAICKLWVTASAELSPAREPFIQWGYRAVFVPLHLLAIIGAWQARGRGHWLIGACLLAFALTTAAFWAHTSHKSYLDPLIFVYASAGAVALGSLRERGHAS